MKKVMMVIFLLYVGSLVFPIMYANEGDCAFRPNECEGNSSSIAMINGVSLKTLIIQGATHFFDSLSNYHNYLKAFEVNDYSKMKIYLSNAAIQMKFSHDIYVEFNNESLNYDYNDAVIERLRKFDYNEYMVTFQLIESVITRVKGFLSKGDVRGAFKEIEKITGEIFSDMESLNLTQSFPEKNIVWRVNQKLIEAQLFGQYLAEIFCQVK